MTAPWVLNPFATPGARLFGFISLTDELVSPVPTVATWGTIGPNHNVVVVDANTPKVGGAGTAPVFAPVWPYLSFPKSRRANAVPARSVPWSSRDQRPGSDE